MLPLIKSIPFLIFIFGKKDIKKGQIMNVWYQEKDDSSKVWVEW